MKQLYVTGCTACSSKRIPSLVEEHVSPSLSSILYLCDYMYSLTPVSYILGLFWKKCSQPSDIYKTWRIWLGDPSYSYSSIFHIQTWELIMSKSALSNIAEIFEQGIAHSSCPCCDPDYCRQSAISVSLCRQSAISVSLSFLSSLSDPVHPSVSCSLSLFP